MAELSLGPLAGGGVDGARPWTTVRHVLAATEPSILESHLSWLVARIGTDDHLSPRRILIEDQVRILVRALDERHEDDVISRALDGDGGDVESGNRDNELLTYATALRRATAGEPRHSPHVALAHSAARVAADILSQREDHAPRRQHA